MKKGLYAATPSAQASAKSRLGLSEKARAVIEKMSLTKRMFVSSTIVLLVFLSAAALMSYSIFALSLESIVQEKLVLHTYQLLSVGDRNGGQMQLPQMLSEPRFNESQSSLIAFVKKLSPDNQQQEVWRSVSAADQQFSFAAPNSGEWFFGRAQAANGTQYYVSSYNTTWSGDDGDKAKYVFTVMEDLEHYRDQLARYHIAIAAALLSFAMIFLLLQLVILRLGLSPVRKITADVEAMNNGEIESLAGHYPKELRPLTRNLNRLVYNERNQRKHYRERMADLSHSLKTPLSVLQGIGSDVDHKGEPISLTRVLDVMGTQVTRMTQLVSYQLQRAIPSGAPTVVAAVDITDKVVQVISALDKVYVAKSVKLERSIENGLSFYGDENDLIEIIGNLLDNAYKHAQRMVRVSAAHASKRADASGLVIVVEDDGKGVPTAMRETIFRRGVQLDTSGDGHGFGLSIVSDVVDSYRGTLSVENSDLGGALFRVTLPIH